MTATQLLVWGGLAHLVVDWVFQNDWMAANKGISWTPANGFEPKDEPVRLSGSDVREGLVVVDPAGLKWTVIDVKHRPSFDAIDPDVQLHHAAVPPRWQSCRGSVLVATYRRLRPRPEGPLHPASYVHALCHLAAMLAVFPWPYAAAIAATHWAVDLRVPLAWWRHLTRQTVEGPMAVHVAIWEDQVVHLAILGAFALYLGRGP
jgi:hypothetical protein